MFVCLANRPPFRVIGGEDHDESESVSKHEDEVPENAS